MFAITVGDPQKVGDPLSAHIVYTVHTRVRHTTSTAWPEQEMLTLCSLQTTSSAYSKSSFSVLRRYSDFLWLYEALSANNPGVIVPPVPEKNPFNISRFEAEFVETRRLGLNKCVQKIANHPVLNKDQDFRFFLESDSFALDVRFVGCGSTLLVVSDKLGPLDQTQATGGHGRRAIGQFWISNGAQVLRD